jgi:hypothetical protein
MLQKICQFCKTNVKPSQVEKLIIFIRKKMTHKGENYSVKNAEKLFLQRNHQLFGIVL